MLTDVIRTVMNGYADRPALGQRAVEFVTDANGRTIAELQPRFDTLTYRETWTRVRALADALADNPVQPGDRVATLGFTSADYAIVDMALSLAGAVSVPLQTSAPVQQLHPILIETEPVVKGQTASGSFKPAKLSNGVRTMVPTHIVAGTRVVVSTTDGSYTERAKD